MSPQLVFPGAGVPLTVFGTTAPVPPASFAVDLAPQLPGRGPYWVSVAVWVDVDPLASGAALVDLRWVDLNGYPQGLPSTMAVSLVDPEGAAATAGPLTVLRDPDEPFVVVFTLAGAPAGAGLNYVVSVIHAAGG